MRKITFQKKYWKLNVLGSMEAKLLDVLDVNLEDLSKHFIFHDTLYDNGSAGGGNYKLPDKGEYLLLIFAGANGLFTTLRSGRCKTDVEYYRSGIGQTFKINFTNKW